MIILKLAAGTRTREELRNWIEEHLKAMQSL
jgi:hypothetical protein